MGKAMMWIGVLICMIHFMFAAPAAFSGERPAGQTGFYPDMDARAGVIHLVYMGEKGGVYYMRSTTDGSTWEGPWGIEGASDANNKTGRPAVAGDSQGNAHITWSNGSNAAFHSMFSGTSNGAKETAISSNIVVEPDITVDSNDVVHVIAMVNDGEWFIGHSQNPGGNWESLRTVSEKFAHAQVGAPSISADDVGSCHAGWKQEGGGSFPKYARFDTTANAWSDFATMEQSAGSGDVYVETSPDGFPRVTWAEYRNSGGWFVYGIMFSWRGPDGWHHLGKISPGGSISEGFAPATPRIAVDDLGRSYISWVATDRLHLAVHDASNNSWPIPDIYVTEGNRQYYHGTCANGSHAFLCYEDNRGGLFLSWGSPEDPPGPVQGDVNGDGRVNGEDLFRLSFAFGASPGHPRWNENADLDNNGIIDGTDLAILGGNFGRG